MRRAGGLFPRVVAFDNLYAAAGRAAAGKKGRPEAARFLYRLEDELVDLERELRDRTYRPGPYRTFRVRDPKPRLISAAPLRDRVVQQALMHVVEPVLERGFIHHSYACRVGKGTHRAAARFARHLRASRWVLRCDIRRFFPSIDHEIALGLVARRVKDPDVLWLLGLILAASNPQDEVYDLFPGDDLFTPLGRRKGIPIGNLTSQVLGNVMLDPIDHLVLERLGCRRYVRYADDFALFSDSKQELRAWRTAIEEALDGLRLKLHPTRRRIHRTDEGVTFLGFRHGPERRRLLGAGVVRAGRRLRQLSRWHARGLLDARKAGECVRAWVAHARHASTAALRQSLLRAVVLT